MQQNGRIDYLSPLEHRDSFFFSCPLYLRHTATAMALPQWREPCYGFSCAMPLCMRCIDWDRLRSSPRHLRGYTTPSLAAPHLQTLVRCNPPPLTPWYIPMKQIPRWKRFPIVNQRRNHIETTLFVSSQRSSLDYAATWSLFSRILIGISWLRKAFNAQWGLDMLHI